MKVGRERGRGKGGRGGVCAVLRGVWDGEGEGKVVVGWEIGGVMMSEGWERWGRGGVCDVLGRVWVGNGVVMGGLGRG